MRAAAAPGKIVIAGTGSESSAGTIDFSNKAAQAGADYSLVVTPFYYKAQMTAPALEAYYREVADQSKIPIILYTVPKFTGLELPLQTIVAMATHPNVIGLKDSSGNMSAISETLKACPSGVLVVPGARLTPLLSLAPRGQGRHSCPVQHGSWRNRGNLQTLSGRGL